MMCFGDVSVEFTSVFWFGPVRLMLSSKVRKDPVSSRCSHDVPLSLYISKQRAPPLLRARDCPLVPGFVLGFELEVLRLTGSHDRIPRLFAFLQVRLGELSPH
jgi:hypothetical protein